MFRCEKLPWLRSTPCFFADQKPSIEGSPSFKSDRIAEYGVAPFLGASGKYVEMTLIALHGADCPVYFRGDLML